MENLISFHATAITRGLRLCASAILFALVLVVSPGTTFAQGCVSARGAGMPTEHFGLRSDLPAESALGVSMSTRWLHSDRHFVGDEEQTERKLEGSQVINSSYFVDFGLNYSFSPRISASLTIPYVSNDRSQTVRNSQRAIVLRYHTQSSGIGDVRFMTNMWALDPYEHPKGNFLLGAGLSLPTGKKDVRDDFSFFNAATGTIATRNQTVDQSIQPGSGAVGVAFDLFAYRNLGNRFVAYLNGAYTITPKETNGVPTYRSNPFEAVMSVADAYMARAGFDYMPGTGVPVRLSLGARVEGVPVHDLVGGSNGFRRPGYAVSIEPGVSASLQGLSLDLYVPVAVYRSRSRSVPDVQQTAATGVYQHGDAAFADFLVMFSLAKRY